MLDPDVCYEGAKARDKRLDGRFFLGVRSTRIFCRAVCPVPLPSRKNITFLVSAAAAQAQGFRPCLRCRPEAAPSSPAWSGTSATVRRALRLIEAGVLNEGSVRTLAARLGVGERQLRRLFAKHLGASPLQVAKTERLLLAKRLLNDTNLSMTHVASAAGFGSVRRFNAAIREVYSCAPRELRRNAQRSLATPELLGVTLRLPYRHPYNWPAMLAFLASRAIPGVEEVRSGSYCRVIRVGPQAGFLRVRPDPATDCLLASVHLPEQIPLMPLAGRLRRLFDVDADADAIDESLERDPRLRPLIEANKGTRIPGAWDGFELGVRAIVGQQISVRTASIFAGRIAEKYGQKTRARPPFESSLTQLFPDAEALAGADLTSIGVTGRRAETIQRFAHAVAAGEVDFGSLCDARSVTETLERLPGIGPWTAGYIAMRAAGDPDAFLETDLVVRRSLH